MYNRIKSRTMLRLYLLLFLMLLPAFALARHPKGPLNSGGASGAVFQKLDTPRTPDFTGAVPLDHYGAPAGGRPVMAAGSIQQGSSTLMSSGQFLPYRWISVAHAGPACGTNWNLVLPHVRTYSCPPGPAVRATPSGMRGNATHTYRIAIIDGAGGEGPAGPPVTIAGATADPDYIGWVYLTWDWPAGSVPLAAIYRDGRLVGVSGHQSFEDVGLGPIAQDPNIMRSPPAYPLHEHLRTRVVSAAGSSLMLKDAASTGVQGAAVFSDDGGMIQAAVNDAERITQSKAYGGARVVFPPGILNLATSVITGPETQGLWLIGMGGSFKSSMVAGPLLIIGDSIGNDAVHGIYVEGMAFSGQGATARDYPAEDGIWIFGSQGVNLDDVLVTNFPHIGIFGEKPNLPGGGGFCTKIDFLRLRARNFGSAAIMMGFTHPIDDVSAYRLFESDAGQQVKLASGTWGAVYIASAEPTLLVPSIDSNKGFVAGLHISRAAGGWISDAHFEDNGTGSNGTDFLIDFSQGIRLDGIVLQETASKSTTGIRLGNGDTGLVITGVRATNSPAHAVSCVVDVAGQRGNSLNTVSFLGRRSLKGTVCNAGASTVQNVQ